MNACLFATLLNVTASAAGCAATLVALSADIFLNTHAAEKTALVQTITYVGAALVGLIGGWIVQKSTPIRLGLWSSVFAGIVCSLLCKGPSDTTFHLICMLTLSVLNGMDIPNAIGFLNQTQTPSTKLRSLSLVQMAMTLASCIAPCAAGFLVTAWGAKACYAWNGCVYGIASIVWLLSFQKHILKPTNHRIDGFVGFKILLQNKNIFKLNLSRLLNNISYVSFATGIPVWVAQTVTHSPYPPSHTSYASHTTYPAHSPGLDFSNYLGYCQSAVTIGFFISSILGIAGYITHKTLWLVVMLASVCGVLSVYLATLTTGIGWLLCACCVCGFGQFFFRISGISIGQSYTPPHILSPVILAGDSIVRIWSAGVSYIAIVVLKPYEGTHFPSIVWLCLLSLGAPFVLKPLVVHLSLKEKESVL
jgi:MFS family permease